MQACLWSLIEWFMTWQIEKWEDTEQYGGLVRKMTYRSICRSPMCPPDTAVTVWQHAVFSSDKKVLVGYAGPFLLIRPRFGASSWFCTHLQLLSEIIPLLTCLVHLRRFLKPCRKSMMCRLELTLRYMHAYCSQLIWA